MAVHREKEASSSPDLVLPQVLDRQELSCELLGARHAARLVDYDCVAHAMVQVQLDNSGVAHFPSAFPCYEEWMP